LRNKRAIGLLFVANSISGFAQGISMIAIPWHFTNVLGLPQLFAQIMLLVSVISIFWGVYSGSLIDRFNRQRIYMGVCVAGSIMLVVAATKGMLTGEMDAFTVGAVFAGTFLIYNIHYPNLYAFIQEISEPKDYGRVSSYIERQGQFTTAIAGAMAAILLGGSTDGFIRLIGLEIPVNFTFEGWSLERVFLLDAATYLVAFGLVAFVKYEAVATRNYEPEPILQRIKVGFSFLKRNPMLLLFGTFASNIFVAIIVINFFLKPVYVAEHLKLGPDVYATYEIYFALGSLFAGLMIRRIFMNTNTPKAIIILHLVAAVVFFIYSFNTNLVVFFSLAFLLGLANAGSRIMRVTYMFQHTPNQLIGRTGSVFMVTNILMRIGFLVLFMLPFFYHSGHIVWVMGIFGAFMVVTALVLGKYYQPMVDLKVEPAVKG
jgi:MFS family permease